MKMRPGRADSATLLTRALRVSAAAHQLTIDDIAISDRPWASATFEGVRHVIRLSVTGAAAMHWLDLLPEAELPARGHIVADLAVDMATATASGADASLSVLSLAER